MSDAWGPRGHPERCDEMERTHRRVSNQIEWIWLVLGAILLSLVLLYREGTLGWWWQWVIHAGY